jgi:hypothetical protein
VLLVLVEAEPPRRGSSKSAALDGPSSRAGIAAGPDEVEGVGGSSLASAPDFVSGSLIEESFSAVLSALAASSSLRFFWFLNFILDGSIVGRILKPIC